MSLTSVIRYVQAIDTATGNGKTGIVAADITAKYLVQGGTLTALTPETITTLGTWQAPSDGAHIRIKELAGADPTKGIYEVHFANAQVAGGKRLWLFLSSAGAKWDALELDTSDALTKLLAAVYDTAGVSGGTITLSNGTTQVISPTGRATTEP